jgi:hypothetical protein
MITTPFIQGDTIPYDGDLTSLGVIDEVIFEVYDESKTVILKYAYPAKTGYETGRKVGDVYGFTITSAQSADLVGIYFVEMTWTAGTTVKKAQSDTFQVIKEAK